MRKNWLGGIGILAVFCGIAVGEDYRFQKWANRGGCSEEQINRLALAHEQACKKVARAFGQLVYHAEKYGPDQAPPQKSYFAVLFQKGNQDFYRDTLFRSMSACGKTNAIAYQCDEECPTENERDAYVNFYYVPRNPIHLCPSFFKEDPETATLPSSNLAHEFGRLFGGISGDEGIDSNNIHVWDSILNRLLQDAEGL